MEQLAAQQQDLATAGMELEHMQREALSKQEQDKVIRGKVILALVAFLASLHITLFQNAMADLQSELQNLRTQFEESLNSHESAKKSLTEQVREFIQQREHAQQEVRCFEGFTSFVQRFF